LETFKTLFPKDVNPQSDTFLGETSVQITGFHEYPSVHLVKSYMVKKENEMEYFYHIFEYKAGTTLVNYGPSQYKQVEKFIDISDQWSLFYQDETSFMPISKDWRKS
jgi:hypothetical protein